LKINFNYVFFYFFKKYRKEAVSKNTCLPFKKIRNKSQFNDMTFENDWFFGIVIKRTY